VTSRRTDLGAVSGSLALLVVVATQAVAQDVCIGDCDGNGVVSINELLTGVNIALEREAIDGCRGFDTNADGNLQINELLGAVRSALQGCRLPDPTPTPTPEEFVAEAADFECLTGWARIRHFRIANPSGHLEDALAVARGEVPPPYPVGTIIQLVPQEAMVKRGAGFFREANDWEFFVLAPSAAGTQIKQRGRAEVVNNRAPTCFGCHSAATGNDFVCETDQGCIALNLSETLIDALQNSDPRCASTGPAIP
jgi:hypothetical protein